MFSKHTRWRESTQQSEREKNNDVQEKETEDDACERISHHYHITTRFDRPTCKYSN